MWWYINEISDPAAITHSNLFSIKIRLILKDIIKINLSQNYLSQRNLYSFNKDFIFSYGLFTIQYSQAGSIEFNNRTLG